MSAEQGGGCGGAIAIAFGVVFAAFGAGFAILGVRQMLTNEFDTPTWFFIPFVVVGAIVAVVGTMLAVKALRGFSTARRIAGRTRVTGQVIEVRGAAYAVMGRGWQQVVVQWVDPHGTVRTHTVSSGDAALTVGSTVDLLVDPDDPTLTTLAPRH